MTNAFKKISYQHFITPAIIIVGIMLYVTGHNDNNTSKFNGVQQLNFVSDTTRITDIMSAE